ncbi:hypothetical protein LCGC14_1237810 [marine sediment metagenome]|uniref:HNH nuclease domain-containing protein n=1 Tax=marine sediment metagenome TaxID=412755 RepID=A0A0F9LTT8_9ZZZZ
MKGSHRIHLKECCEACGRKVRGTGLTIHHISSRADNGPKNLQTLCHVCHTFWHNINSKLRRNPAGRMPKLFKEE